MDKVATFAALFLLALVEGRVETPKVTRWHVVSKIADRYARTVVESKMENLYARSRDAVFSFAVPERARIVNFFVQVENRTVTAHVQGKQSQQHTWNAKDVVSVRDSGLFAVKVNLQPKTGALFHLAYEELLQRRNGYYDHVINVNPKQLVRDLRIEVKICEQRPLVFTRTPPIRAGNAVGGDTKQLPLNATVRRPKANMASVTFAPGYRMQRKIAAELGTEPMEGLNGQFVVQYEVERDPSGGQLLTNNGYFVHFFAPSDLEVINKHVVFVLDTSGSMRGCKMSQLKSAMRTILGRLRPDDRFNLVAFYHSAKLLDLDRPSNSTFFPILGRTLQHYRQHFSFKDVKFPPAYQATRDNVAKAREAVDGLMAKGATNVYEALRVAIQMVKLANVTEAQPLIFFLTDGSATVGETSRAAVVSKICHENTVGVPIITVSFGKNADRRLLEQLSMNNRGFTRHVYDDDDARVQLEDIFGEISMPLLKNASFHYGSSAVDVTRSDFPVLYQGSELVVAGRVVGDFGVAPSVKSWTAAGLRTYQVGIERSVLSLERLWAFLSVNHYLDAQITNPRKSDFYQHMALDLGLNYSFVTPLTSLVVDSRGSNCTVDEPCVRQMFTERDAQEVSTLVKIGNVIISEQDHEDQVLESGSEEDDASSVTIPPSIHEKLPWLQQHLRSDGSLSFFDGSFRLGFNVQSPLEQECITGDYSLGYCKLIKDCGDIYANLTDLQAFRSNFCNIYDKYAGVCCPKQNRR